MTANAYIETGFTDLDQAIGGLKKGSVTIISARPAMGIIALAGSIARNVVHANGDRVDSVLAFTDNISTKNLLEGNSRQERIISSYNADNPDARCHVITLEGLSELANQNLCKVILSGAHAETMKQKALEHKAQLLILDSDVLAPYFIADKQKLAQELNIPVLICLNLPHYKKHLLGTKPRPTLKDLKIHKDQLACADVVMSLHRDAYYYPDKTPQDDFYLAELEVLKNSSGKLTNIKIRIDLDGLKFDNVAQNPPR